MNKNSITYTNKYKYKSKSKSKQSSPFVSAQLKAFNTTSGIEKNTNTISTKAQIRSQIQMKISYKTVSALLTQQQSIIANLRNIIQLNLPLFFFFGSFTGKLFQQKLKVTQGNSGWIRNLNHTQSKGLKLWVKVIHKWINLRSFVLKTALSFGGGGGGSRPFDRTKLFSGRSRNPVQGPTTTACVKTGGAHITTPFIWQRKLPVL